MTDPLREQQLDILRKLAEQGDLTARGVLSEAQNPDSPLHQHPAFTWDLTEAAQKQWLVQARRVIQEFRRECVIIKGKIVPLDSQSRANVKQGRTVKLRDWHPIRPEASSPTHPDEDPDADSEAEPAHEVPQTFVHTSAILEDRDLKVEAAATFFRTIRGFRSKCFLYEDIDRDFKVIGDALDRISGRLEAGEFGQAPDRSQSRMAFDGTDAQAARTAP